MILPPIGVIFNLFHIKVLLHKQLRSTALFKFLLAISLCDFTYLLVQFIEEFFIFYLRVKFFKLNSRFCDGYDSYQMLVVRLALITIRRASSTAIILLCLGLGAYQISKLIFLADLFQDKPPKHFVKLFSWTALFSLVLQYFIFFYSASIYENQDCFRSKRKNIEKQYSYIFVNDGDLIIGFSSLMLATNVIHPIVSVLVMYYLLKCTKKAEDRTTVNTIFLCLFFIFLNSLTDICMALIGYSSLFFEALVDAGSIAIFVVLQGVLTSALTMFTCSIRWILCILLSPEYRKFALGKNRNTVGIPN
ncbi:hypothetical protein GCK72_021018 [Caenorhabditis remanei]|uniref:G-protein coupled receptors family 1 profile domain-containing protein n=1 Tax=Caenorhabditis remanei TaxID=31234 RepID=A0A6A5GIR0_CAERE|nr:hypothetical protein GCK72_021018 [Caenorhabditis remanei]KAF1754455.1 hypothetical protein GCK72_021018 [Caenorhabditis remanei]